MRCGALIMADFFFFFTQIRPYNYNQFHHINSPTTPSPRYVSIPKPPLPPIPHQAGFSGGLPGLQQPPKLQEQQYPDTDEIYERIDEAEEQYESSYIYQVETVPNRPSSMGKSHCTAP